MNNALNIKNKTKPKTRQTNEQTNKQTKQTKPEADPTQNKCATKIYEYNSAFFPFTNRW